MAPQYGRVLLSPWQNEGAQPLHRRIGSTRIRIGGGSWAVVCLLAAFASARQLCKIATRVTHSFKANSAGVWAGVSVGAGAALAVAVHGAG